LLWLCQCALMRCSGEWELNHLLAGTMWATSHLA
jgi:hypothetical protein